MQTRRSASSACACVGAVEAIHVHTSSFAGSIVAHSLNEANAVTLSPPRAVWMPPSINTRNNAARALSCAGLICRTRRRQAIAWAGVSATDASQSHASSLSKLCAVNSRNRALARGLVTRASSGNALLEQGFFVNG